MGAGCLKNLFNSRHSIIPARAWKKGDKNAIKITNIKKLSAVVPEATIKQNR